MAIVSTGQIYLSDTSDGISLQLSPPSISIPANSAGTIVAGTYTSTLSIYIGATNDSANWAYSVALGTGVTGSIGAATGILSVTALSQDTSYVDITAKKFGYSDQTIRCVVAKVRAGADSTVAGSPGATAVTAYKILTGTSLPSAPAAPTGAPTAGNATGTTTWYASPATSLASNQWLFQATGTLLSGTYTWDAQTFLATFKVGALSALSADLGTITAGSISGTSLTIGTTPTVSGSTMTGTGASITTAGNFALGNSTTNISFNGTTMTLNGNVVASGNIQTGAVGTVALSGNAVTDSASSTTATGTLQGATLSFTLVIPTGIYYLIIWFDSGAYVKGYGGYVQGPDGPEYNANLKAYEAPLYNVNFNGTIIIPTSGGSVAKANAPTQYVFINPSTGNYPVTLTRSIADGVTADSTYWAPPTVKWLMLKK